MVFIIFEWEVSGNRKEIYIFMLSYFLDANDGEGGDAGKSPERAGSCAAAALQTHAWVPRLPSRCLPCPSPHHPRGFRAPRGRSAPAEPQLLRHRRPPAPPRGCISLFATSLAPGGKSQPLTLRDKLLMHIAKQHLRK